MQSIIKTRALQRSFGEQGAVRGIDLEMPGGAIYGFLGPNGAGKTTTIRLLLGLLRPDGGTISMLGLPMPTERIAIARSVGALVETPALYDHLTGRENIDLTRRMLGLPKTEIDRVLEIVDLASAGGRRVQGYSLGMRQRLGLARALIGDPRLLILDEPTNGLDPDGIRAMRDLIRALPNRSGTSVFVSSHLLAEIEQVATHVGLMFEGRLLAQGALCAVLARQRARIEIVVDRIEAARAMLEGSGISVEILEGRLIATSAGRAEMDPAAINALLVANGFSVSALARCTPTLEDLYVSLTGQAARGDARAIAA